MNQDSAQNLYIFEGLSHEEIVYFLMMAETCYYKDGEVIMNEGDESDDRAYFIQSGAVDVFRDEKRVTTIEAGGLIGELALITNEPRTATIVTKGDTELLAFNKDEFLLLYKKSDHYETIKEQILKRIKDNFYGIHKI